MDKQTLLALLNQDTTGLLDVKPRTATSTTPDERLLAQFQEIIAFHRQNGKPPERNPGNPIEKSLFFRLQALRQSAEDIAKLKQYDEFDLLPAIVVDTPTDSLAILLGDTKDYDPDNIFNLTHVTKSHEMPEYVAQRKPCQDFDQFEPLFKQCQAELKSGVRRLVPFKREQDVEPGHFFVMKGVLLYVASAGEKAKRKGKTNARTRCIFENGTESDLLMRSLSSQLYQHGLRVTHSQHDEHAWLDEQFTAPKSVGYIYVLRSHSPKLAGYPNAYKVGHCVQPVEQRIKNAHLDPTFLMDRVDLIASWTLKDYNVQKVEYLLHTFFAKCAIMLDAFDVKGKRHTPREWFEVPLPIINEAIDLMKSGNIIYYHYDSITQQIVINGQ
jgi:T5orf172 domain